jgi:hypothetical protein
MTTPAPAEEKWIGRDKEGVGPLARNRCEGRMTAGAMRASFVDESARGISDHLPVIADVAIGS